jgi:hypothetical protein
MAKVRGPLLSERASGKFGEGLVFYVFNGRQRVRAYSSQTRSRTPNQSQGRGDWAEWSKAWRVLDITSRAEWNLWAANHPVVGPKPLGGNGLWSGFDWYVHCYGIPPWLIP